MNRWDEFGIRQAKLWASMSKDPSTKVGAYIADSLNRPVSGGFNGFPRNVMDLDSRLQDRSEKYPRMVHAELNALLNAPVGIPHCSTMYVYGLPCCANCIAATIQRGGVTRILQAFPKDDPRALEWDLQHGRISRSMAQEAGIELINLGF